MQSPSLYRLRDLSPILEADEQGVLADHLDVADQLADGDLVKLCDGPSRLRQLTGDFLHPPVERGGGAALTLQLRLLRHQGSLRHIHPLDLLIVVQAVGPGADGQLEQLQLTLREAADLRLQRRQGQLPILPGEGGGDACLQRLPCGLGMEQLVHGGGHSGLDVRLIPGGGLLADLFPVLQAVDAPPDDPLTLGPAPHHPAVGAAALAADQQFAEDVLAAVFAQLCLGLGGGLPQAGAPGQLLLHPLEGVPVDDGGVALVDVVLGQLPHILPLLMGEEVRHEGLLRYDPITDTIQFFLWVRVQGGSNFLGRVQQAKIR